MRLKFYGFLFLTMSLPGYAMAEAPCHPQSGIAVMKSSVTDIQIAQTGAQKPKPTPTEDEDELGEDDC